MAKQTQRGTHPQATTGATQEITAGNRLPENTTRHINWYAANREGMHWYVFRGLHDTPVETRELLLANAGTEGQVTIHVHYTTWWGYKIRIWPTTRLLPHHSEERCELVHAENIGIYPEWLHIGRYPNHHFTLVFSALPKDCTEFDLVEQIPEPGGFVIRNIKRNHTDVYYLEMGNG